jgi:PAS domain-containing protein
MAGAYATQHYDNTQQQLLRLCLLADDRPGDSNTTCLAAAVQQHPVSSLRAIEAGLRAKQRKQQLLQIVSLEDYNPIGCMAEDIPISAWFVSCVSSPMFWSGGESAAAEQLSEDLTSESDEVIAQVASLLQTCLKISGFKSGKAPSSGDSTRDLDEHEVQAQHHHRCINFALSVLQRLQEASVQLAALRSGGNSSSSSSSVQQAQQVPCYAAPALLHLAGVCLILLEPSTTGLLQAGDLQHQQLMNIVQQQPSHLLPQATAAWLQQQQQLMLVVGNALYHGLQHVALLGRQLQQLLLPGKEKAAAAALQGLQEKQQQLQQSLRSAVWRLNRADEIVRQHSQQLQRLALDSSSSSSTVELFQGLITQWNAATQDLVGRQPPGLCNTGAAEHAKQQSGCSRTALTMLLRSW